MRPLHLLIPFAVALGASAAPFAAQAQVALDVSVTAAPPELPVYEQPPLPDPGYIFMPGYWAYGYTGYYWVPGTWVEPPQPGLLWTPGYWGFNAGRYVFNTGYWGPTVGFYGGINYGFGYGGLGYEGGYWRGGSFFYNRAVNNFGGVHVTNVFERNVTHVTVNRYSFNGPNGVNRRPSPVELAAARAPHVPPTAMQVQHIQAAQRNPALQASVNHGRPAVLATARPASFGGGNAKSPVRGQAPAPHSVMRSAPMSRPDGAGVPRDTPPSGRAEPAGDAMAPHPVQHTAAPHPVAREPAVIPHEASPMRAPMSRPPVAPMSRPAAAPMNRPAAEHRPAAPPREAPPARTEKPKR